MNKYRVLHYRARAAYDRSWRSTFMLLANHARIPAQSAITVTVAQTCKHHSLPDIGANYPTAKAAIDGLVDAGVIPDDDPAHLVYLGFAAPERGDEDRLILIIEPAPPSSPSGATTL